MEQAQDSDYVEEDDQLDGDSEYNFEEGVSESDGEDEARIGFVRLPPSRNITVSCESLYSKSFPHTPRGVKG